MQLKLLKCISHGGYRQNLTIGKLYLQLEENEECYYIIGDTGSKFGYFKDKFIVWQFIDSEDYLKGTEF